MIKKPAIRFATTVTLSYCLSLFLLILITGIILMRTLMSPAYTLERIGRSEFTEYAHKELRDVFISYGLGSGFPAEVMTPLITREMVDDAVKGQIEKVYGIGAGFPFDRYAADLYEAFYHYALSQGKIPDGSQAESLALLETGLRDLADLCADALKDYVDSPVFSLPAQAFQYRRALFMGIFAVAALAVITAWLPALVNRRVTRRIDSYIYALGAVSLICAALPALFFGAGLAKRLRIAPPSYHQYIASWLNGIVSGYSIALVFLLALLGLCVAARIIRRRKRWPPAIGAE